MAVLKYGLTVVNAKLDQIEVITGTLAKLNLFSGAIPANCSTAATGSLLAQLNLPSDWMNAAATGQKTLLGAWANASIGGTGTIGYFRIYDSANTVCTVQGDCTNTGGGGAMTLDNTVVNAGQSVTVTTFTVNTAVANYP